MNNRSQNMARSNCTPARSRKKVKTSAQTRSRCVCPIQATRLYVHSPSRVQLRRGPVEIETVAHGGLVCRRARKRSREVEECRDCGGRRAKLRVSNLRVSNRISLMPPPLSRRPASLLPVVRELRGERFSYFVSFCSATAFISSESEAAATFGSLDSLELLSSCFFSSTFSDSVSLPACESEGAGVSSR